MSPPPPEAVPPDADPPEPPDGFSVTVFSVTVFCTVTVFAGSGLELAALPLSPLLSLPQPANAVAVATTTATTMSLCIANTAPPLRVLLDVSRSA
jgi:hypothetical protein